LIPGSTQKMLTAQLRELERDGIVFRKVYPQVPPKVEYSLTKYGMTLKPFIELSCRLGNIHVKHSQQRQASPKKIPERQLVAAKWIMERETGRSRGFGFVEMGDDAHAQAAIQKLNGSTVGTRQIVVNVAKPMEARSGFSSDRERPRNSGKW